MSRFSALDRQHMFDDVERWEPLTSFTRHYTGLGCSNERTAPDSMKNFKVETLFDYSLLQNGHNRKKIIQLDGIAPIIEDEDDPNFKGDSCQLEHRRRTEGTAIESHHSMEVPIALTRYLRPNLKFDIVTTKTFLAMLCRFIDNEHRFYRFDIERVGNLVIIEEVPYGDARPSKTYLQGALDILTGRASMDYRQVSICEFGTKRILLRQHVDLAESSGTGRSHTQTYWQRNNAHQYSPQDPFFPTLKDTIPSIAKIEGFIDQPEPIFHIDGTNVAIQGPLVPETPKKPIEIMCRSFQRFSFENLQMKWPNMIFSGADRIVSVLHVRGLIDHKPKSFTFEDIAPKGYKNTMARASALCRHIFDYIQTLRCSDCDKMALIWVNDKQLPSDVNDGNHLVLYRRRQNVRAFDESAFVSPPLRSSILRTFQ
uniref:Decapping nuclease n=1 Tax=Setaria digitata TaxID=48799 RepID=A0A915PMH7_9BILA